MEKKQEITGKVAEENGQTHQQDMHGEGAETLGDTVTVTGISTLNSDKLKEEEERIKRKEDWLMFVSQTRMAFQDVVSKATQMEELLEASPLYWTQHDGSTSLQNGEVVATPTSAVHQEENVYIRECHECLKTGQTMNLRHIRRECPYGGINVPFNPISICKAPKRCWNCGGDHLIRFCNIKKR